MSHEDAGKQMQHLEKFAKHFLFGAHYQALYLISCLLPHFQPTRNTHTWLIRHQYFMFEFVTFKEDTFTL